MTAFRSFFSISRACGLLVSFLLVSCGAPSLVVRDRPIDETKASRALTSASALARETVATLRSEDLLRTYRRDPNAAILALADRYEDEPTNARRLALVEIIADTGDKLSAEYPYNAIGYYLDAARLTEDGALEAIGSTGESSDQTVYNYCAARVARLLHYRKDSGRLERRISGPLRQYRFTTEHRRETVDPASFDVLVPDSWLEPRGIRLERIEQAGFGMAMVGLRKATPELKKKEPAVTSTGFGMPLNASFRFSGSQAKLVLQDLMLEWQGEMEGKTIPLAGDYTAPLYFLYDDGARTVNKVFATLRPGAYKDTTGMYMIEPYQKDKIPLVLVHGLMSTAEGWLPFANELRRDPVVREKYQLVFFNYPTGSGIGKNAADLRDALAKFRMDYDPKGTHPNMRKMVILGHSMGGIISNMQIRDSGDHIYDTFFNQELDELNLDEASEKELRRLGFFKANSDIKRAVFIASPLRGSVFASNRVGRFSAWLIRLPFNVLDAAAGQLEVINAMTDVAQQISQRPSNSVNGLRLDNPLLPAVLELPVTYDIPVHSIIAQMDPEDPLLEGSDGVVVYTSAHLDDAVSEEIVVGANHRSVLQKDECFEEVWRILYLHAGEKQKR